jgi:hypothetical protein
MTGWRARTFGAAAWVAVVAVGAVLVWLVISRAGAGLVADAGAVTAPSSAPAGDGSTAATPGAARRASWQGESGVVTAVCRDGDIALVGAQPEDSVVVHVKDQGPEQLVVEFEGNDEGPVTVVATCRGGRPQFTATVGTPAGPSPASPSGPSGPASSGGDYSGGADGSDDSTGSGHGSGHPSDDGSQDASEHASQHASDDRSDGASGDH